MRKEIVVGLIIGVLFSVIAIVGMLKCQWNPAHYIYKGEICDAISIFFLPVAPQSFILFVFGESDGFGPKTFFALLIMIIITILIFCKHH